MVPSLRSRRVVSNGGPHSSVAYDLSCFMTYFDYASQSDSIMPRSRISYASQCDSLCLAVSFVMPRSLIRYASQCNSLCLAVCFVMLRSLIRYASQTDSLCLAV